MADVSPEIENDWLVDSASVLPDGTLRIIFCDPDKPEHYDITDLMLEGLSLGFFRRSLNNHLSTFGDLVDQKVIAVACTSLDKQELETWARQGLEKRLNWILLDEL